MSALNQADSNVDSLWDGLKGKLDSVYLNQSLSRHDYMTSYTSVYNYCTNTNALTNQRVENIRPMNFFSHGAQTIGSLTIKANHLQGADLYTKITDYVGQHIQKNEISKISSEDDNVFVQQYIDRWDKFRLGSRVVDGIFDYLNRHWVRREVQENINDVNVYSVYGMCLNQWRLNLFEKWGDRCTLVILKMIESDRMGDIVNTNLIKHLVDSYVQLGVQITQASAQDGQEERRFFQPHITVYKEKFQKQFLEATAGFYLEESRNFIGSNSVSMYMEKALSRIEEEMGRCRNYLHPSTEPFLRNTLENALIISHLEQLKESFVVMLANNAVEDLGRMYKLVSRVENGVADLLGLLKEHVVKRGHQVLIDMGDSELSDCVAYISAVLSEIRKFDKLLVEAFENDASFQESVQKAIEEFVNVSNLEGRPNFKTKAPEMLAKYSDQALRRGSKLAEVQNIDVILGDILCVFKYIEDKDVFEKFYSKSFAYRVIRGNISNEENEELMISKLKESCGFEYAQKLSRMFQDYKNCKSLNSEFRSSLEKEAKPPGAVDGHKGILPIDLYVLILTSGTWPSGNQAETAEINLPDECAVCVDKFQEFYLTRFNGRKLTWNHQLSRCDLQLKGLKSIYQIQASILQTVILLKFNDGDCFSYGELYAGAGVKSDAQFRPVLHQLLKFRLLKLKDQDAKSSASIDMNALSDDSRIEFNSGYKSRKIKININMPTRQNIRQEEDAAYTNIQDDRKSVVDARIVRIMKSRKEMKHSRLIAAVLEELSSRFTPDVTLIKKSIESLVQRDYLKRDEKEKDTYHYVA